jgi:PAS domain S-box-containing protein
MTRSGAVTVIQDISELRRAQTDLARREREFRTLAENAPFTIARFDRALRLTYVNPQGERSTGLPAAAMLGKTLAEMGFAPEAVDASEEGLRGVFESARPAPVSVRLPGAGRLTMGKAAAIR